MHIALIFPSPAPFVMGGVESLAWSLTEAVNQMTPHHAELIKLPVREQSFAGLLQGYRAFHELDVSHFDMAIVTKYPAWMTAHENTVCYMQHCLRGLYDTYHLTGLPLEYETSHAGVRQLQQFMEKNAGRREAAQELLARVEELQQAEDLPEDAFAFPGPLARSVVRFLDAAALAGVRRFAAISQTVAGREYFPEQAQVEVIHHPSSLRDCSCRSFDYLFTVSRLDHPKRIDLLIKAMSHVSADIQLRIAGVGPQEDALRELAAGDPRIVFEGFVDDARLEALYADAMAVLYVPYDEDMGLITIEAMKCGKPVITVADAGGPNEFVTHGETGYSVAPVPEAIGEAVEQLVGDPAACRRMGSNARKRVATVTWRNTVSGLLGDTGEVTAPRRRIKLVAPLTYPVYPPRGGGQNRVYHLYKQLAREFDVTLITLANYDEEPADWMIAKNLREVRVPKSEAHMLAEWKEYQDYVDAPVTDAAFPLLIEHTPDYVEAFKAAAAEAGVCVVDHPFSYALVKSYCDGPLWHNSHNVEYDLKKPMYAPGPVADVLLQKVWESEQASCRESGVVMVCSGEDRDRLVELYGANPDCMVVVPNGVDVSAIPFTGLEERREFKAKMGEDEVFSVLFMGSWHGPNLEACDFLLELAKQLPDVRFLFMGSCCNYYCDCKLPANVFELGVLDNAQKEVTLSLADAAVNPVVSGSGTNLKLLEYLAAGLPAVSTPFGARGLGLIPDEHIILAELEDFAAALQGLREEPSEETARRILAARQEVERRFDWSVVARQFLQNAKAKSLIP